MIKMHIEFSHPDALPDDPNDCHGEQFADFWKAVEYLCRTQYHKDTWCEDIEFTSASGRDMTEQVIETANAAMKAAKKSRIG